ncbi:hypothetical protein [Aeromicrobium sp. 179-A 4D2 NHS]|uniref:hypothetical protein n=1 Tax=Aeromicrobium sp. 179-A 4D2 NHS TaxID=3142375 RepID=UPI0039A0C98A
MSHRHFWQRLTVTAVGVFATTAALMTPTAGATAATAASGAATKSFTSVKARTVVSTAVKPGTKKTFSTKAPKSARGVYLAVYVKATTKGGTIRVRGVGRKAASRAKVTVKRQSPAARTILVPVASNGRAVLTSSARGRVQARIVGYSRTSAAPKVRGAKASKTVRGARATSVSLASAPAGATAAVVTMKTWGAKKAARLSLCSTRDTASCRSTVRAVATKGRTSATKTIVPLLGSRKLTLRSSTPVSAKVNVQGYVIGSGTTRTTPTTPPGKPGVPAGVTLRKIYGDQTITKNGTVLDGVEIFGRVSIKAANVTIKNSRIRGQKPAGNGIVSAKGSNTLIKDVEIFSDLRNPDSNGIMGYGFTLNRVQIRDVVDSVHVTGDNVRIKDSWLHSNTHYEQDPNWGGKPSHDDNIQIVKGNNIVIEGTHLEDSHSAAVMMVQDQGPISNVTLRGNTIGGGACSVNMAVKGYGPLKNILVTTNTFKRNQTKHLGCAVIAPAASVPTLVSNVWYHDGSSVKLSRG